MQNLLFLLIAFISLSAQSQQVNQITIENWDANNWINNSISTYSYNPNNQIASVLDQSWNGSGYENASLTTYSNYMGAIVGQQITQTWSTNTWNNNTRIVNTAQNNLLAQSEFSTWFSNTWNNFTLNEYSYGTNNYLTYFLQNIWDNTDYRNNSQIFYTNNSDGLPTQLLGESWNTSTSTWRNSFRTTNTYNSDNKIILFLNEIWDGSAYVNNTRNTYTYDGNGFLIEVITEIWDSNINDWEFSTLLSYQNNPDGSLHIFVSQFWNASDTWENLNRWTYTYNTLGTNDNALQQVVVYPNPAKNFITLQKRNDTLTTYELIDLEGRSIQQGAVNGTASTIDVRGISVGVYMLRIPTEQGVITQRIVKE